MTEDFDQVVYWRERHNKLRGDHRATANISRSSEEMLQRKLVQAYFFSCVISALESEIQKVEGIHSPLEILDVGFGTGFLGSLLTLRNLKYTGYDLSEVAAEDSLAICPRGNFLIRNIVEHPAQSSDIIIASELLFHIVNDYQWINAISNIAQGMRSHSILMFTETFVKELTPGPAHFKPRTREMYAKAFCNTGLRFMNSSEIIPAQMSVFNQNNNFKQSVHFVKQLG